jgi:putative transposase
MPNYRRYYTPVHPIFLTIVTHHRRTWLADDRRVENLLHAMRWAKTKYPFRHVAHVVLPDHLHWMLSPADETSFSDLVAAVKRDVTWRLKELGSKGPLWQKRFYDHVIRDDDDFGRHLDYVHFNPVKHGYVSRAANYQWSSFHEWVKRGVYDEDWGATEPAWIKDMDLE